jgi:hypothetical protein
MLTDESNSPSGIQTNDEEGPLQFLLRLSGRLRELVDPVRVAPHLSEEADE